MLVAILASTLFSMEGWTTIESKTNYFSAELVEKLDYELEKLILKQVLSQHPSEKMEAAVIKTTALMKEAVVLKTRKEAGFYVILKGVQNAKIKAFCKK